MNGHFLAPGIPGPIRAIYVLAYMSVGLGLGLTDI
jgi:hypothetical protein